MTILLFSHCVHPRDSLHLPTLRFRHIRNNPQGLPILEPMERDMSARPSGGRRVSIGFSCPLWSTRLAGLNPPRMAILQGNRKNWLLLGLIALVAVTAGLSVPSTLATGHAEEKNSAVEPAAKGKLTYTPPVWPEAPSPQSMLMR